MTHKSDLINCHAQLIECTDGVPGLLKGMRSDWLAVSQLVERFPQWFNGMWLKIHPHKLFSWARHYPLCFHHHACPECLNELNLCYLQTDTSTFLDYFDYFGLRCLLSFRSNFHGNPKYIVFILLIWLLCFIIVMPLFMFYHTKVDIKNMMNLLTMNCYMCEEK